MLKRWEQNLRLLSRDQNRGPYAAPQGLYSCADAGEYVALAVATDAHWKALRSLMGDPEWARDAALDSAAERRVHHDAIDAGIETWLSDRKQADAVNALLEAGVPAHPVINAHYVMPNPQLEHRRFYQTLEHPVTGETRYPGLPMRFSALGDRLHRSSPPTLGQHNREILCGELGLSEEEFEALLEKQIIGDRPSFM